LAEFPFTDNPIVGADYGPAADGDQAIARYLWVTIWPANLPAITPSANPARGGAWGIARLRHCARCAIAVILLIAGIASLFSGVSRF
jgi:hypothetical protein